MFYYTHSKHTQNKKVALYADSALLVATGHLLLSRTSVRGVEVAKHGLRLRITCNNFSDSTMSTRVLAGLIQYGYILARPQGECIWLVAKIGQGL